MDWLNETTTSLLEMLVSKDRLGIVMGMDGTIAAVSSESPDGHSPSARCREVLQGLSQITPLVAILSARPAADLHVLVDLPDVIYAGNRGLETWIGGRLDFSPEVEQHRPQLESAMMALYTLIDSSIQVEDAGSALMIYCEAAPAGTDMSLLRANIKQIAEDRGLRFFEASRVMEVRPPMILDKGRALERLINQHQLDAVIYLGNDLSDVDAFTMLHSLRDLGQVAGAAVGVLNEWTASDVSDHVDVLVKGVQGAEDLLDWVYRARGQRLDQENRETQT
jgi:trehalose 6-phosphate phosphatase